MPPAKVWCCCHGNHASHVVEWWTISDEWEVARFRTTIRGLCVWQELRIVSRVWQRASKRRRSVGAVSRVSSSVQLDICRVTLIFLIIVLRNIQPEVRFPMFIPFFQVSNSDLDSEHAKCKLINWQNAERYDIGTATKGNGRDGA